MNAQDEQLFNQAVAQAQAGNTTAAYDVLSGLRFSYPQDIKVLLWCAYTAPDLNTARTAIAEAARLQPGNKDVVQAQGWLALKEMQGSGNQPQASAQTAQAAWPQPGQASAGTPLPTQYQVASTSVSTSQRRASSARKSSSVGCFVWLAIIVVVIGGIIAAVMILSPIFAKNDAETVLNEFLQAASRGDTATAYNQVLPTITQDELNSTFLTPNANNLKDYSRLAITDTQYYDGDGGGLIHVKGTVFFKTLGKSTFEADVQHVDEDERSYIVSFQLGPPAK